MHLLFSPKFPVSLYIFFNLYCLVNIAGVAEDSPYSTRAELTKDKSSENRKLR